MISRSFEGNSQNDLQIDRWAKLFLSVKYLCKNKMLNLASSDSFQRLLLPPLHWQGAMVSSLSGRGFCYPNFTDRAQWSCHYLDYSVSSRLHFSKQPWTRSSIPSRHSNREIEAVSFVSVELFHARKLDRWLTELRWFYLELCGGVCDAV